MRYPPPWLAAIPDCGFAVAVERVYLCSIEMPPARCEETGHVRDVAVLAACDPGHRAAQPYSGAADAPVFGGQGIPDRLASDERRQVRGRWRGPGGRRVDKSRAARLRHLGRPWHMG